MRRFSIIALAFVAMTVPLASCAVVDSPISATSGPGVAFQNVISFADTSAMSGELQERTLGQIKAELVRVGYRIGANTDYVLEFGIGKRPVDTGILLPENDSANPEEGSWRSRPVDKNAFALCKGSLYRLMIVISKQRTGEIVFRVSSDNESCGTLTDEKLHSLVASSIAGLQERSLTK